ncbi:cobalt ABC transporter permease [Marmoricola sp. Leaf446]|uniref:PDGLE domain-containing protein n=1 Tax=Marmoricola sp. Leaf446 TaxID=1736379 RepID=UPI0006FAF11A|nr:PDGLE domain-containing protein [Marmoricola sp. Leaf446]KQT89534.1 cobalt ABC transporter permease [Marmoricola sp. Leaf446]
MSRRGFLLAFLLVSLVIAGVGSYYASSHPDGLEFVAERTGFLDSADDSPAAASPLADYQTKGVEDERVSGGLAGVIGAAATLLVAGGLFRVLRRRGPAEDDDTEPAEPAGARVPQARS